MVYREGSFPVLSPGAGPGLGGEGCGMRWLVKLGEAVKEVLKCQVCPDSVYAATEGETLSDDLLER